MLKHSSRSRMNSVKKKALEKSVLQDMNFLSLKEFYNSIPGMFKDILMQQQNFLHVNLILYIFCCRL